MNYKLDYLSMSLNLSNWFVDCTDTSILTYPQNAFSFPNKINVIYLDTCNTKTHKT